MIYLNVANAICMLYLFVTWKSSRDVPWVITLIKTVLLLGASYNIVEVFKLIGLTVKVSL